MKILMVCLGNICRSPMAEGIMKSKLPGGFKIDSCGTIAMHEGEHPDPRAIKAMAAHGLDISRLRSRPIKLKDLETFDRIYCMDLGNYKDVISMARNEEERSKIKLLMEASGLNYASGEVPDPYFGGDEGFEKVYQLLDKACSNIAIKLVHPPV